MSKADYYDLLGVSRDASLDDIKKSYRKLAKQCHPDTNPDDDKLHRKFQEITEAYEVLRDDQKRAAYDRYGHDAFEQPGGGAGGGGFRGGFGGFGGFGDIFDEIFGEVTGQRRGRQPNNRGADLRYNMTIDLEDAFRGRKTTIRVPTAVVCQSCHGSGSEGGSVPGTCDTCQGRGRVRAQQGFFTIERTCPTCHGAGQVIKNPCHDCSGSGRVAEEKSLSVNIPEGVEDGTRIRLAGEGEAGMRGGPAGDLYIFLTIKPHPLFSRDGPHLMCTVPITMVNAALGGEVEVPSVDGSRARINVPAGTQTGTQFRLRGKGMSILRTKNRGDLFVKVTVETPVNLTSEQRDLLEKFASASGNRADHHPESAGFFQKVKEFFEDLKD